MSAARISAQFFAVFLTTLLAAQAQKPVVNPGGVVNAANYAPAVRVGGVGPDSIVSIFGQNLARETRSADSLPLPTSLAGTAVTVAGRSAQIFFVSPGQVNILVPANLTPTGPNPAVVVTTDAGSSQPIPAEPLGPGFGIFTMDGSGCGPGAVMNIGKDGSFSLNSPSNSASPGDFITVFGTGSSGVFNPQPGGALDPLPTPSARLVPLFAGRAPGLPGVDQINLQIPINAREGCSIPLTVYSQYAASQPVPVAIRKGGGPCVDPPSAAYGQFVWERVVASGTGADGETERFSATLTAAPGLAAEEPRGSGNALLRYTGPCTIPGYTPTDAGAVMVSGPGLEPLSAVPTVVRGQTVYQASLPKGTIQPGVFQVRASGGKDVGPFQSEMAIGSGIHVTSAPAPGTTLCVPNNSITVNWTGGDPDAWVRMTFVHRFPIVDEYTFIRTRASAGTIQWYCGTQAYGYPVIPGPVEIVLELTPDPAQESSIAVPGLSLGGQHTWKYTYRFGGLSLP